MKKQLFILASAFVITANAQIINTVAGNGTQGYTGDGGAATAAELSKPAGIAFDASGNMYIADQGNSNIRKITTAGIISTAVGGNIGCSPSGSASTAYLFGPTCVVLNSTGVMYIADQGNNRIVKVVSGAYTTVAGSCTLTGSYGGEGGQAASAKLNCPLAVALDAAQNLYIADACNSRIRKVNYGTGIITTIVGTGVSGFSGDGGQATAAKISDPTGIALDAAGNIYIADAQNFRIRKITTSGIISTIAGTGTAGYTGDGGLATAATLGGPSSVSLDATGNIYITDWDPNGYTGNEVIREINTTGIIRTVAGNGTKGFAGDGGQATAAELNMPTWASVDAGGNLYIADQYNHRIRKVSNVNTVEQFANNNKQVSIYPNPSSGALIVSSKTELGTITIYNSLGGIVLQTQSKNQQEQIDISKLLSGIYIVETLNQHIRLVKE